MKLQIIAKRMLQILSVALLLGVFGLIINDHSINGTKGSWTNIVFAQEKPSSSVNEAATPEQDKIKEEFLPGSCVKTETAVKKASLIIVGKFLDTGILGLGSTTVVYGGAKVEILQILKGYVPAEFSLNFKVHDCSPDMKEKGPEVGQRYIIFIREKTGMAIKFLPDTDEQRWRITELVSAAANKDH